MDESGSRHPDHVLRDRDPERPDAFAFGGVLVNSEDEDHVREAHRRFCRSWRITYPLHFADIRVGKRSFGWLRSGDETRQQFSNDLRDFLCSLPVIGLACVIDRPGHASKYLERYGENQWRLCRTAFSIAVERAAKHALATGRVLCVHPERCNRDEDVQLKRQFAEMKAAGLPFNENSSAKYRPLDISELRATLYDIDFKQKTSPMAQIADLYLWPMKQLGYASADPLGMDLIRAGRLIDCHLDGGEKAERGIKYSCFELVHTPPAKTTKAQTG